MACSSVDAAHNEKLLGVSEFPRFAPLNVPTQEFVLVQNLCQLTIKIFEGGGGGYFTTDGSVSQSVSQSVSMSWYRAPLWDLRLYFLSEDCCLKFAVLFLWGALSDERKGLQFAV
jgi:hypothetical protein